jgi:hypothetical protein
MHFVIQTRKVSVFVSWLVVKSESFLMTRSIILIACLQIFFQDFYLTRFAQLS